MVADWFSLLASCCQDGYLVLLRLADVVDDTVAFNKTVWQEMKAKEEEGRAVE